MIDVPELIRWLKTLESGSSVGIDEGGLTLREVSAKGEMTEAYMEVGGIPEGIENEEPFVFETEELGLFQSEIAELAQESEIQDVVSTCTYMARVYGVELRLDKASELFELIQKERA